MIYGLDYLAGALYGKSILAAHPQGFAAGFFAETFGDAFPVIEALVKTGKCPLVRVQLLWSDAHRFGDKDIPKIRQLSRKCQALANKYPHVDFRISPFCEYDNLNNIDKYCDICQLEAPNCTIVANPNTGRPSKKYINEAHGTHKLEPGRTQYSVDGGYPRRVVNPDDAPYDDIVDKNCTQIKSDYSRAEVFFFWHSRFNLRYRSKDKASRPDRIKDYKRRSPSPAFITSIALLASDKGATTPPRGSTIKSHAENHGPNAQGQPDTKGDKFLIIYLKNVKEIVLKKAGTNTIVAKLPQYGSYSGGGWRFYAAVMGWQLGKVDIYANGKKVGTINCVFRDGVYR